METLPGRTDRRHGDAILTESASVRPPLGAKVFTMLIVGLAGLVFGANYLIESVVGLSGYLHISAGAISLFAVAIGTSLPELLVSVRAALAKKSELALGNIFGSNIFNMLIVTGIPGLFGSLPVDIQTLVYGLPMMIVATALFVISGISRRIHIYEGAMYLIVYVFFIGKVFGIF
jgi:cation:H+ antiporter